MIFEHSTGKGKNKQVIWAMTYDVAVSLAVNLNIDNLYDLEVYFESVFGIEVMYAFKPL